MTSVGIYARISDDRDGSGLGVARQEQDCRHLADTRGWTVIDVYIDNDLSAYSGKPRPSYQRLLEDLKAGRINGVVAWHPDRLHRRPIELEAFIDVIETTGAVVATVQAGDLDLATASGRMTARIVGAVARHESEHKSERHKAKARQMALAGKVGGGGTRPYGYEKDRITVVAHEADIVREMADRIAAGETLRAVIADLNRRGILTATGKKWQPHPSKEMLLGPRIAGLREHLGEVVAEAEWPALVDRQTWETVRRILTDPGRRQNTHVRKYLLTGGLSFCGLCDAKLVARPRDDKRRCYVCAKGPGCTGCGKIRILAEWIEDYVVEMLMHRLEGEGLASALAQDEDGGGAPVTTGELLQVEGRLDELAEMFAAGQLGRREWLVAREKLQGRRDELAGALAKLGRRSAVLHLVGPGGPRGRWETLEFDTRRAVLATVLDRVVVGPAVWGRNTFDPDRMAPPRGDILWRL